MPRPDAAAGLAQPLAQPAAEDANTEVAAAGRASAGLLADMTPQQVAHLLLQLHVSRHRVIPVAAAAAR